MRKKLTILLIIFTFLNITWAGGEWHNLYKDGLKQMKQENWQQAARLFKKAILGDRNSERT